MITPHDPVKAAREMYAMGARHMLLDAGLVDSLSDAFTDARYLKLMADYDRSQADLDARIDARCAAKES